MPRGLYSLIVRLINALQPKNLIIISPFLDEKSVNFIKNIKNIKSIIIYTKPPEVRDVNESHKRAVEKLCKLKGQGLKVILAFNQRLHKKIIYINNKFRITGSLNFASWSDKNEEEIMIFTTPHARKELINVLNNLRNESSIDIINSNHLLGDLALDLYEIIESIRIYKNIC